MSEYLVEKYASTLSSDDILTLFEDVVDALGSISKAAENSNIERRTYYKLKEREYIQLATKEKILRTALDVIPGPTAEFMLQRKSSDTVELIQFLISLIYEKAISEENRGQLLSILNEFNRIYKKYESIIIGNLEEEVSEYIYHLQNDATIKEVNWKPEKNDIYKLNNLKILIPIVIKELKRGNSIRSISDKLLVPELFIQIISDSLEEKETISIFECEGFYYGPSATEQYWRKTLEQVTSASDVYDEGLYIHGFNYVSAYQTPSSNISGNNERRLENAGY